MAQKCEKLHQNDVSTRVMTQEMQKKLKNFWIPIFGSKFQFSQPG